MKRDGYSTTHVATQHVRTMYTRQMINGIWEDDTESQSGRVEHQETDRYDKVLDIRVHLLGR
jgi:hypothetical protein